MLKNFHTTAIEVSSGPEEQQHSLNIVDELAVKNGYEPRKNYPSAKKKKNKGTEYRAPLKLPYLSDNVSNKIRNYVKSRKLTVRIIFTPGNTLQQMFCSSRPFDFFFI